MNSSDIRDILQIDAPTEPSQKKSKANIEKRPEGISRELYSLIGGAPPVAFVKPTFKARYQTKKKATPWILQPFVNPARADDLELKHWIKANEADNQDYHFAKFNKVIDIIEYTDEDYEKYLTDTDWSKEETDYLFDLCRKYDLRFPVIEDRYNFESKPRTMEDLKDRFYTVNRKLILQGKGPISGDYIPDRQSLAQQYAYDKSKEVERKNALIMLFNRTKEQIEEEEALFVEAKRIESNEARFSKERESLLNSLQLEQIQHMASTPSTSLNASSSLNSPSGILASSPGGIGIAGGTAGSSHSTELKKKKKSSSIHEDSKKKPEVHENKKEKLTPGVYVRSQKLPIVKPTMQAKVIKILDEMGIGPRPIMPTSQICQKFETLQNSILNMLELKKVVDKTEVEHKVKVQKGRDGTPTGRKRAGSNAGSTSGAREKRRK
ncbi:MAG: Swr1 complex subunit Swc4 [Benjaminiella poitrasii]|nr:MAG: Swr1 complex subunit Swc4 [Benjaminiella poitrasii]